MENEEIAREYASRMYDSALGQDKETMKTHIIALTQKFNTKDQEIQELKAQVQKMWETLKRIKREALDKTMDTVELESWLIVVCEEALESQG